MTPTSATETMTQTSAEQRSSDQADAIRPFHANFPEAELTELRRRINATKWPERETVTDASECTGDIRYAVDLRHPLQAPRGGDGST